ncbi:hypothetical protein BLNAU_4318 [Blattamonas nauphoetae]|uniref:Uncharacterized protein n=1 Tax=Blattamonas nauphoetae TaxID=2049346 RepID=A0ABQ9YA78_9EUKA|nr:hypothetical protein BLNAU_4318 [Blattamonas nauphoetae]
MISNEFTKQEAALQSAKYHGLWTEIINRCIFLLGNDTYITHSQERKCSEQNQTPTTNQQGHDSESNVPSPIFKVTNSALSAKSVNFHAEQTNHLVAFLLNSSFSAEDCSIHSSGTTIPIIAISSDESPSVVHLIRTQHYVASIITLDPIVKHESAVLNMADTARTMHDRNEGSKLTYVSISYRSNETIAILTLSGKDLAEQDHTLFVQNSNDEMEKVTIPVSYSSSSLGGLTATVSLVDQPLIKYGESYTVTGLKVGSAEGEDVEVSGTISFRVTDEPAEILDISFSFDENTQSTGTLTFKSLRMPTKSSLIITVEGTDTFNLSSYASFTSPEAGSVSVLLYSPRSTPKLEYGQTYTITRMVLSSTKQEVFFTGKREIVIPQADPRVIAEKNEEWFEDGSGKTFSFWSTLLDDSEYEMELKDITEGAEDDQTVAIALKMKTEGTRQYVEGSALFYPASKATLKYSHSYKVSSVVKVTEPATPILVDTITITIPAQQSIVTSLVSAIQPGTDEKYLQLVYESNDAESSYLYPTFEGDGGRVNLSSIYFGEGKATQKVQIFGTTGTRSLEYGKRYKLVSLAPSRGDPLLLAEEFVVEVPVEPARVWKVSKQDASDGLTTTLTFSTRMLENDEKIDIAVSSSALSHSTTLTATVSGTGDGQTAVVVASLNSDGSGDLFNNATYKVTSVTRSTSDSIYHEDLSFDTPIIPPTITDISIRPDPNTNERYVIIRLEGKNIDTKYWSYVHVNNSYYSLTSAYTFNSTTWGEFSVEVYNSSNEYLEYGKTYTVTSIINRHECHLAKTLSFVVPAEKPRLASVSVENSTDKKSATFTFTTRLLEDQATYRLLLKGVPTESGGKIHSNNITATVSSTSSDNQVAVANVTLSEDGVGSDLINGHTYYIHEIEKIGGTTEPDILIDYFGIQTQNGPARVTSCKAYFYAGTYEKTLIVEFGGTGLKGLYSQRVTVNDGQNDIVLSSYLSFSSSLAGNLSAELTGSYAQLKYGQEYKIVSIAASFWGDAPIVSSGLKFSVPKENPRLITCWKQTNETDGSATNLVFKTNKMEDGETYEITLAGAQLFSSTIDHTTTLKVQISTEEGQQIAVGTGIMSPPESASILYNMNYTAVSMKKCGSLEEDSIVIEHVYFWTPKDNRQATSASADFLDQTEREIQIEVRGQYFPIGSTFLMTIGGEKEIDLEAKGVFHRKNNGTITARLFSKSGTPELEYGHTYTVSSIRYEATGSPVILAEALTFSIPAATQQIIEADCLFDAETQTALVTMYGNEMIDAAMTVRVSDEEGNVIASPDTTLFNEETKTLSVRFNVGEDGQPNCLMLGKSYTIKSVGEGEETVMPVCESVTFKLSHTPKIKKVDFEFANKMGTKARLHLTGSDFPENEVLVATLTGGLKFQVNFGADGTAVSDTIEIGFEDTMAFETEYSFVSLTRPGEEDNLFDVSASLFKTGVRPTQPEFVIAEGDEEGRGCGDEETPCGSIKTVLDLSLRLKMTNVVMNLKGQVKQKTGLSLAEQSSITLQNPNAESATLKIPGSASHEGQEGLILVNTATLSLQSLEVTLCPYATVEVLVVGSDSTVLIENCVVSVEQHEHNQNTNGDINLCSWASGLLVVRRSTTNLINSSFTDFKQGVMNVRGGSLKIENCALNNNGNTSETFPSIRQNIACEENGTIDILSSPEMGDSLWISTKDCQVTKDTTEVKSPLFVSTLDAGKTAATFDTNTNIFTLKVIGTHLIPCNLRLDVFEVNSKDKTETGASVIVHLDENSTSDWSETALTASIPNSLLSTELNSKFDWHVRLMFGPNEVSTASIRLTEHKSSTPTLLAWLLPVVISVTIGLLIAMIVACVCVRRRKMRKGGFKEFKGGVGIDESGKKTSLSKHEGYTKYSDEGEDEFGRGSINTPPLDVADPSLEDPQNFVIGQCSHFKGTLKGFSNLICQDPQDPEFSAILELNTDATFTSNPFDLDLTFMQFEEYFGTFDQSPFQDKYEKYWKDTPIDVIGRFKEGSLADGQFRIYQFVIERPSRPSNDFGFWRGTIRVRVAITQSGDIQRFIAENERLEIVFSASTFQLFNKFIEFPWLSKDHRIKCVLRKGSHILLQIVLNEPDTPPPLPATPNEQHRPSSLVFREVSHLSTTLHDESTFCSLQNPAPSSFGNITITTLEAEDTHLSTQMPSPPSLGRDYDIEITSESTLSPSEDRKQTCLHLLEMMEDLRRRRTDEHEEEWDLLRIKRIMASQMQMLPSPFNRLHFDMNDPDVDMESVFEELEEHEIENDGLDFHNPDESSEASFQQLKQSHSLQGSIQMMIKILSEELDDSDLETVKHKLEQVLPGTETSDQQLTVPPSLERISRKSVKMALEDRKTRIEEDQARRSHPQGRLDGEAFVFTSPSSPIAIIVFISSSHTL